MMTKEATGEKLLKQLFQQPETDSDSSQATEQFIQTVMANIQRGNLIRNAISAISLVLGAIILVSQFAPLLQWFNTALPEYIAELLSPAITVLTSDPSAITSSISSSTLYLIVVAGLFFLFFSDLAQE